MCEAQTGLSDWPELGKLWINFVLITESKRCIKMATDAAVTNRGYCWGENKHLHRLTLPHVPLRTVHYSKKFGFMLKTHHDQHRQWRGDRKISNGKGSLGHCHLLQLQQAVIELGLLLHAVQSVSSFWHQRYCIAGKTQFQVFDINGTALLVKLGTLPRLPDLKINTGQELFLMLLTAGTCGKRPGLRNPSTIWDKGYFYLLFIHTGPVTGQELFLMLLTAGTCGKRPGLRNPSTIWDKG